MKTPTLKASIREQKDNTALRAQGLVPAVVYGKKTPSFSVSVDEKDFIKLFREVGENTVFTLKVEEKKAHNVIVRDVQYHPLSGDIQHIDFYAVSMTDAIETVVGLEFIGEAPAVKELGGTLVKNMDEVEVKGLPGNIPHTISVDVSALKTFDDAIYVKDLKRSDDVEILSEEDTSIAFVSQPREETEEELIETPDVSQVEVEEKGKKEEKDTEEK